MPEQPQTSTTTDDIAVIDYTNHRGERGNRVILPLRIWFGSTPWHPTNTWLLEALDLAKGQKRDFDMACIHSWRKAI